MKHVKYADRSLFLDDETADLLVAYADALGSAGGSDTVHVQAVDAAGNDVGISLLLNGAEYLAMERAVSPARVLRDETVVEYLSANLRALIG